MWGSEGGLEWHQNAPNTLLIKSKTEPMQVYRTGNDYNCDAAKAATRTPASHPEGYLEAFANLYLNFANHIRAVEAGERPSEFATDYPKIDDGIRGMAFIEAVVASSAKNAAWTKFNI